MMGKEFKYYVPGHGRTGDINMARNYRTYLDTLLSTVRELYAQQLADYEIKPIVDRWRKRITPSPGMSRSRTVPGALARPFAAIFSGHTWSEKRPDPTRF